MLALLLRRQGVQVLYGSAVLHRSTPYLYDWHAFNGVEVQGRLCVVDVTATQFGMVDPVYVGPLALPVRTLTLGLRPGDVLKGWQRAGEDVVQRLVRQLSKAVG